MDDITDATDNEARRDRGHQSREGWVAISMAPLATLLSLLWCNGGGMVVWYLLPTLNDKTKETTPKSWLALPILAMSVEDDFFWRARVILKSAKKYFFVDSAERPQRIDFLAKNEANVVPVFLDPLSHRFV